MKIIEKIKRKINYINRLKYQSFKHTGKEVVNTRDGKVGVVLFEWKDTGQIAVLENIRPYIINTHDSWKTLKLLV